MKYLLDSNAWIGHLRQTAPSVTLRLKQNPPADVFLCSVVIAELHFGALRSTPARRPTNLSLLTNLRQQFLSLPFDDRSAEHYGEIRAFLAGLGKPIGPNDLMIAAIALANGSTVVTHNTAEFSRVPGLLVEDWQIP